MSENGKHELLSLVLTLKPTRAIPAPPFLGRATHSLLLRSLADLNPALSEACHAPDQPRPFTASALIGPTAKGLDPQATYVLRMTALTAPVAEGLMAAAQGGRLAIGQLIMLDKAEMRVTQVAWTEEDHPWAGCDAYDAYSAPWLLAKRAPSRRLRLQLSSPTTFRSGGMHIPFPMPGLVFGSLAARWNAFSPVGMPEDARRYAEECLAISRYQLRTRTIQHKASSVRKGAVGWIEFYALNPDRYWLSMMHLLAGFALYAGIGAGTSMGLGQARREQPFFKKNGEHKAAREEALS